MTDRGDRLEKAPDLGAEEEWNWFDRPRNRRLLWILLIAACVGTVVAELFVERHPHFAADNYFASTALIGFAACATLIFAAKLLGKLLKREEDYYDHDE